MPRAAIGRMCWMFNQAFAFLRVYQRPLIRLTSNRQIGLRDLIFIRKISQQPALICRCIELNKMPI
jgi:hypothetical protein